MSRMDDDLRFALRRKEPPPGFADRVLARLPVTLPARRPSRVWRWAAAAAACVLLAAGGDQYYQYRRGMEAKRQLLLALEITQEKLELVESRLKK